MNTPDLNEIIAYYIQLRDTKDATVQRHKAELKPLNDDMEAIENALQKIMLEQGTESIGAACGTAYTVTHTAVKIQDWEKVLDWISENDRWDILDKRINKTVLIESGSAEVCPGIALTRSMSVNVRRSS